MSTCGDNKNSCHNMKDILNIGDHVVCYCTQCKKRFHVNINDKKRAWSLFRKHTLQPGGNNLYYKYYSKMNVL